MEHVLQLLSTISIRCVSISRPLAAFQVRPCLACAHNYFSIIDAFIIYVECGGEVVTLEPEHRRHISYNIICCARPCIAMKLFYYSFNMHGNSHTQLRWSRGKKREDTLVALWVGRHSSRYFFAARPFHRRCRIYAWKATISLYAACVFFARGVYICICDRLSFI